MKRKSSPILRQVIDTVILTALIFLFLITFVIQGYKVYGSCMEPNLQSGERLLGNKLIYHFAKPNRGDVIVFRYPKDPRKIFVKRVVALPGEIVEIRKGILYINGKPLDERRYLKNAPKDPRGDLSQHRVAPGHLFVLGDNRDQSNDSRSWGDLPIEDVQAKVWIRYWPLTRCAIIN
jgi:signal peptidase I